MALRLSHLIDVCILDTHRCCSLLFTCTHYAVPRSIYSTVLTTCYSYRIRTGKVMFLSLPGANHSIEVTLTAAGSWF